MLSLDPHFWGGAVLFVLLMLEIADRVVMKRDLEIARDIQKWLLPAKPPQVRGLDIAFAARPANTVAVSYTHLDVYKRQTPDCAQGNSIAWPKVVIKVVLFPVVTSLVVIFHCAQAGFPGLQVFLTVPRISSPGRTVTGVLDHVIPWGQQSQLAIFHGPAPCWPSFHPSTGWIIGSSFGGGRVVWVRAGKKNNV